MFPPNTYTIINSKESIAKEGSATANLRDIPLFQNLSETELVKLKTCLKEKAFRKGELLFYEGKSCERIFIVRSGRVKIYRMASTGKEQILETLDIGDTCACNPGLKNWNCTSSAEAVTDCSVWYLSRDDYVRLVESDIHLARTLNRLFAERLRNFSTLIEQVSLMDVKKRLVKFLLDLEADGVAKGRLDGVVYLPFTREEIAARIGAARETVARQLSVLQDKKLIHIQPSKVIIRDKEGLRKLVT